jgi:hypothetical protein
MAAANSPFAKTPEAGGFSGIFAKIAKKRLFGWNSV